MCSPFVGMGASRPASELRCMVGGVGGLQVLFVDAPLVPPLAAGMSVLCSGVSQVLYPQSYECTSANIWVTHFDRGELSGQRGSQRCFCLG